MDIEIIKDPNEIEREAPKREAFSLRLVNPEITKMFSLLLYKQSETTEKVLKSVIEVLIQNRVKGGEAEDVEELESQIQSLSRKILYIETQEVGKKEGGGFVLSFIKTVKTLFELVAAIPTENGPLFLKLNIRLFQQSYQILNRFKGFNAKTVITLNIFLLQSYLSFIYYCLRFSPEDEFENRQF